MVALFALIAIVLLEAAYAIAISLARWTPVIAIGALGGWIAHGYDPLQALGVAALACLIARHLLRPRRRRDYDKRDWPS